MLLGGTAGFSLVVDCADATETPARSSAAEVTSASVFMAEFLWFTTGTGEQHGARNIVPVCAQSETRACGVAWNFARELSLSVDGHSHALAESTLRDWDSNDHSGRLSQGTPMRLVPLLAFGAVVASSVSAYAYSQKDAAACMSDAFRLCSSAIPDAGRVATCLHSKRQHLSAACADAFARYTRASAHRRHGRPLVVYRE